MAERRKLVKLWRRISMGVLHREKSGFRLMAIVADLILWEPGEVWATNKRMAREGGGCDEKTIQRDVGRYVELGLFSVSYGWRQTRSGEFKRTRTIKLTIPTDYRGEVPEDDLDYDVFDADHGCPYGGEGDADHGCPDDADHGCPVNGEDYDGAGGDDAA